MNAFMISLPLRQLDPFITTSFLMFVEILWQPMTPSGNKTEKKKDEEKWVKQGLKGKRKNKHGYEVGCTGQHWALRVVFCGDLNSHIWWNRMEQSWTIFIQWPFAFFAWSCTHGPLLPMEKNPVHLQYVTTGEHPQAKPAIQLWSEERSPLQRGAWPLTLFPGRDTCGEELLNLTDNQEGTYRHSCIVVKSVDLNLRLWLLLFMQLSCTLACNQHHGVLNMKEELSYFRQIRLLLLLFLWRILTITGVETPTHHLKFIVAGELDLAY
ncbi:unnamed protein product [Nyctereutes procyonoides]|uniref:(raccoon dog) hypothetical protein n=1 Tax=Nyctereutes procyonoides TaxID=34880 RepID=A0A811YC08_NYCPR|nr:unnamed protein product [Nyctereutes procyonoides]